MKVLNQNTISAIVYGGEDPNQNLRLEASVSSVKGAVQAAGSSFDIIINSKTGRISHANTSTQNYSLPDVSGELLCSGRFTITGDMVYASSPGTFEILHSVPTGALVSNTSGVPVWTSGSSGQVLTVANDGSVSFAPLPDSGAINSGAAQTVGHYASSGSTISSLTTIAGRVLTSPSGHLTWSLLTAPVFTGSGGSPLSNGTSGQVLSSLGDGSFAWVTAATATVNPGTQYYLPYYSLPGTGSALSSSSFISTNETIRVLSLGNQGRTRFYEATANGSNYIEFRAAVALAGNTSFILPSADGVAGATLTTDGAGNLSFTYVDNGTVFTGASGQITYYAADGNDVSGMPTVNDRALLSPAGTPTWSFIGANYLQGASGALANGSSNQVLVSRGDGSFGWSNASALNGEVLSGQQNFIAFYPVTGTSVDDTSFLSVDNTSKILNILGNGSFRIYDSTTNAITLKTATNLSGSTTFILPSADGTNGQVLGTDGIGNLSFITVGRGTVATGSANTLAYYPNTGTQVESFPSTANRALLTTASNVVTWNLIQANYLAASGGGSLATGNAGDVLIGDGTGSFSWTDITSVTGVITNGIVNRLPYYSTVNTLNYSSFIETNEASAQLKLLDGSLLIYSGNFYSGLTAGVLAQSTVWTLPLADASEPGQVLISDASGHMSWSSQVDTGIATAIAYYPTTDRNVAPASNAFYVNTGLTFTGSSFLLGGGSSSTTVTVSGGSADTGSAGSLNLLAGKSASGTNGILNLGVGENTYLTIADTSTPSITVASVAQLQFIDGATNVVGFAAPATISTSTIWKLPVADGNADQVLKTDGAGNLSWASASGTIITGTSGKFAYYSDVDTISPTELTIPTGLPATANTSIIVDTAGSMAYQMLVTPSATSGEIAYYVDAQTIGYGSLLYFIEASKTLELKDNSKISLFDASSNKSVSIVAPTSVSNTYTVTLPVAAPTANGQVLEFSTTGSANFVTPGSNTALQQNGVITVPNDAEEVTVLYGTPFASTPKSVVAQWAMTGAPLPAFMPTITVDQTEYDGFVLQFSAPTPANGTRYSIYWESKLLGDIIPLSSIYFAGGDSGTALRNTISSFQMDTLNYDTISLPEGRGYAASISSLTAGKICGGVTTTPTDSIVEFSYATGAAANITSTLNAIRSGAAGLGTRSFGYILGGENSIIPQNLNSVEKYDLSTDTALTIGATISSATVERGAATNTTTGCIVHSDLLSTIELLDYTLDTLSTAAVNFGTENIQVGCNNKNIGYLAKDDGTLYTYGFNTETVTLLASTLNSTTGIAGAGNSMRRGVFIGSSYDNLNFVTGEVSVIGIYDENIGASSCAFQTNGLL